MELHHHYTELNSKLGLICLFQFVKKQNLSEVAERAYKFYETHHYSKGGLRASALSKNRVLVTVHTDTARRWEGCRGTPRPQTRTNAYR